MEGCSSYREIDMTEGRIDPERVRKLAGCWGVTLTDDGKVRIPVCSYDDAAPYQKEK